MSNFAQVHSHFAKSLCGASKEWIEACIQRSLGRGQLYKGDHDLIKSCWEQWLSTDITAEGVQKSDLLTFPSDEVIKREIKVNLPTGKKYTVMILSSLDIGVSGYSQLQKLNNVKDENSSVSADIDTQRPFTANWEPKVKKIRKFIVTDGKRTLPAFEYESLMPKIPDPVSPGLKVTIGGPLVIRRGQIMLKKKNILKVHGGFVEKLAKEFGSKNILESRLRPEENGILNQYSTCDLPTQNYVPQNRPIEYKNNIKPEFKPKVKPLQTSNFCNVATTSSQNDSLFNDDNDDLFANISMPENPLDDDCDDLFLQVEMPTKKKRM